MLSRVIQNSSYGTQTFSIDNVLAGNYGHVPASSHQLAFNTTVALGNWTSHGSNTEQSLYVHDKRLKFCGPNHTGYMAASFACKPHEQNTIDLDIERREAVGNMVLLVMDVANNVQLANYTLPQGNNSLQHISLNFNPGSQSSIELRLYNIGCYTLVDDIAVWYNRMVIHTVCDHSKDYRFGFNGMEKDNELKGTGNSYDFGARIYDSRLGRWLSVDPLMRKYPGLTPYNFVGNSPIIYIDPNGREIILSNHAKNSKYAAVIKKINDNIENSVFGRKYIKPFDGPQTERNLYLGYHNLIVDDKIPGNVKGVTYRYPGNPSSYIYFNSARVYLLEGYVSGDMEYREMGPIGMALTYFHELMHANGLDHHAIAKKGTREELVAALSEFAKLEGIKLDVNDAEYLSWLGLEETDEFIEKFGTEAARTDEQTMEYNKLLSAANLANGDLKTTYPNEAEFMDKENNVSAADETFD